MGYFNTGDPEIDAIQSLEDMVAYGDKCHQENVKKQSRPILCDDGIHPWAECTCDTTGISAQIFAFRDCIGRAIKVWTCEDIVTIEQEGDNSSLMFTEAELTDISQRWLAHMAGQHEAHQHVYALAALDTTFETCPCGVARRIS